MSEENDEPPDDFEPAEDAYRAEGAEEEDGEGYDEPSWETMASWRVKEILDSAELDEESGTVTLQHEDWDPKGRRDTRIFRSYDEMRAALVEIGDEEMTSHVPWDHGPVFSTDSDDIVDAALERAGLRDFFESVDRATGELLVSLEDLCVPEQERTIRLSMEEVNALLIEYLAAHPDLMHELHPRRFEELVAELFHRMGYEVLLTPPARDGGRDVLAFRRDDVGTLLTLVECKRFHPRHKVGVALVRGLYGVVEEGCASHGVIATTSSFTSGAAEFQKKLRYRLSLTDFDDLARWCAEYRQPRT